MPSTPQLRIGLLVNPTSGRGRGAAVGVRARSRLAADGHEILDLSGSDLGDSRERAVAALAADAVDLVCVVGGDGMVHLAANLTAGRGIPFAIVPAGTGNDNARALGLPMNDPEAAAGLVTLGRVRTIDAGRCVLPDGSLRWWIGVLGGGFDSVVVERAARMRWPTGALRYPLAVLRELPTFAAIPYVVTIDGVRRETEAMLVAVANGPAFGGGMLVCPDAEFDDGLFDILILHQISIPAFLKVFPRVFRGTHVRHPRVEILRGRRVRLEADGIVAQADGERFARLPIEVEVVPGALRVVAPRLPGSLT